MSNHSKDRDASFRSWLGSGPTCATGIAAPPPFVSRGTNGLTADDAAPSFVCLSSRSMCWDDDDEAEAEAEEAASGGWSSSSPLEYDDDEASVCSSSGLPMLLLLLARLLKLPAENE